MIGIIGAGGWGTALAKLCGQKQQPIVIWAKDAEVVQEINSQHTNQTYLPGVTLPEIIRASDSLEETLQKPQYLIIAVPSQWLRGVLRQMAPFVKEETIIISTSKGIEIESLATMSEVITQELPQVNPQRIVALSGPNHAEEVARNLPSATVVATPRLEIAEKVQDLLISNYFRVYTNPDRVGVQLGGALKNIIALAAGISDGLGFGDNTKAALLTRGLAEMARLGVAMGAKSPTFAGLSGMGDLFVTAASKHSRNSWAGREIGSGKTLNEIIGSTKMVIEGVNSTKAVYQLAQKLNIQMPITSITHQILFEGLAAAEGVTRLMSRMRTHEMEDVVTANYTWL